MSNGVSSADSSVMIERETSHFRITSSNIRMEGVSTDNLMDIEELHGSMPVGNLTRNEV